MDQLYLVVIEAVFTRITRHNQIGRITDGKMRPRSNCGQTFGVVQVNGVQDAIVQPQEVPHGDVGPGPTGVAYLNLIARRSHRQMPCIETGFRVAFFNYYRPY